MENKQLGKKVVGWMDAEPMGLGPRGMWPQGVRVGNQIFLQGQSGFDMQGQLVGIGDAGAQARNACANIKAVLGQLGAEMSDVVKITVYVTDIGFRPAVYKEITEAFGGWCPCSTGLVVKGLARPELLVEIDAFAVLAEG